MTRSILIIILFFAIELSSCKKRSEPAGIMINIQNNTSFRLDSVKLFYDTSNHDYGTILSSKKTEFFFFESMPDGPAASADSATKKIFAGHLIPPNSYPLPMLESGKYTLQIFPDSTLFYHYGAKFIRN